MADEVVSNEHKTVAELLVEIEQLRTELERTRQAWVDGDDPMCDDVCLVACKGPCGVSDE